MFSSSGIVLGNSNIRLIWLGAFEKLWKVTISFVSFLSIIRLSVRTEQLGSHWTDFYEISY